MAPFALSYSLAEATTPGLVGGASGATEETRKENAPGNTVTATTQDEREKVEAVERIMGAPEQHRKYLLGEELRRQIAKFNPMEAQRLAGVLLGMKDDELIDMLLEEQSLRAKVEEVKRLDSSADAWTPGSAKGSDRNGKVDKAEEILGTIAGSPPGIQRQLLNEALLASVADLGHFYAERSDEIVKRLSTIDSAEAADCSPPHPWIISGP